MTVIPAIDILGGECVRLVRGDYQEATVYERDPVAMARKFAEAGAKRIHVVDLDAARGDSRTNRKKIRKIRRAVDATIQLGGGIRRDEDIEELLDLGIDRLVIGTAFARKPEAVAGWVAHYGDVFLVGIDALDGVVRISGWEKETQHQDVDLAKRASEARVAGIIYTSIERDGTMEGPDIERTNAMADASGLPVILSGGIGSMDDLEAARTKSAKNVVGVIVGKAIYEGTVDLETVFRDVAATGVDEMTW
ncbi:MAG TPA: 1-(5-phosphoribosyl)-5-[(5-phosphoribosylamino)methylideneamino]imidazole-4-carboxamide isomerase [Spirochaetia bacterium]|nr:1-(5-phosphoribosyl)-5-[(5-phosphoribosylamino)methylideneamino]imidazole-4-carboxamide isomerase [Spirochaetia bacterium]